MTNTLELSFLHPLIFIGVIIGIIIWGWWGVKHKSRRSYIISPLLYLFHLLLFYSLSVLYLIPHNVYIIWIDLVYIHSLIVLISAGWVMSHLVKEEK